jgi:hypothetical protein
MKTMVWKELRENFKWALLALACLFLAQIYALSSGSRFGTPDGGVTLCSSIFLLVTSFGYALAGAGLGCVQILPELNRDRWAALLHRPVGRDVVFFGKAVAGILLYLFATLVPFFLSVAYVAVPGQFGAPLVPSLLLPGLSDVACGLAMYLAALLLCLHRGRWFGSRGAMALALVPLFVLHVGGGWPFLLPLGAAVVFLFAARGAMLTNGPFREMPRSGRIACVTVVFAGAYAALILIVWGLQVVVPRPAYQSPGFTNFVITSDGKIFLMTHKGDGAQYSFTDTKGEPVTDERYVSNEGMGGFLQTLPLLARTTLETSQSPLDIYLRTVPRNAMNYVRPIGRDYDTKETWYFVVSENYFVGYDKLSRRSVGICDSQGFRGPDSQPDPFPTPLSGAIWSVWSPYLFWDGSQVYEFDFSERKMKKMFNSGTEKIFGGLQLRKSDGPVSLLAIGLKDGIRILDAEGNPRGLIPYLKDPAGWGDVALGVNEAGDRVYLLYSPDVWGDSKVPRKISLEVSDVQGNILESFSHDAAFLNQSVPSFWPNEVLPATLPPALELIAVVYRHLVPPAPLGFTGVAYYPRPFFAGNLSGLWKLFGVSLVLAAVAWGLAFRCGMARRSAVGWSIFVFCLGLPAFLAFLVAADWPKRVRCPDCRRKRPVESDECPSCRKSWRPPARNGAEIFEPTPVRSV